MTNSDYLKHRAHPHHIDISWYFFKAFCGKQILNDIGFFGQADTIHQSQLLIIHSVSKLNGFHVMELDGFHLIVPEFPIGIAFPFLKWTNLIMGDN